MIYKHFMKALKDAAMQILGISKLNIWTLVFLLNSCKGRIFEDKIQRNVTLREVGLH